MDASKHQHEVALEAERLRRVSQILAGGLIGLKRRGTLSIGNAGDGRAAETSFPISSKSPPSRLESSAESGLTVHDG